MLLAIKRAKIMTSDRFMRSNFARLAIIFLIRPHNSRSCCSSPPCCCRKWIFLFQICVQHHQGGQSPRKCGVFYSSIFRSRAVQRLKATRPECIRQHLSLKLPLAKTEIPTCMASSLQVGKPRSKPRTEKVFE